MRLNNSLNKSFRKKGFLLIASVLLIIYITDSLLFATNSLSIFNWMKRLVPIILAALLLLFGERPARIRISLILVCFSILISMLFAGKITNGFFYYTQIGLLIFSFCYAKIVSFNDFADTYLKWMRIIVIVSLIGWVFSGYISRMSFLPTITNTVNNTYKSLLFTNVPLSTSLARRNWGPFWEPGVFQFYINIGVIFSAFRRNKGWYIDVILFIIADLTTLSGAAILPLPFVLIAFLFSEKNEKKLAYKIFISIISVIIVFALFGTGYFDEIVYKVLGMNTGSVSIGYRIGSAWANIKAALSHPFFGASPEVQGELRMSTIFQLNGKETTGNTNTLFGFFSYFGIPVGIYLSSKLFRFTGNFTGRMISRVSLFIAIFLATSNENLIQSMLLMVMLFIGSNMTQTSEAVESSKGERQQ